MSAFVHQGVNVDAIFLQCLRSDFPLPRGVATPAGCETHGTRSAALPMTPPAVVTGADVLDGMRHVLLPCGPGFYLRAASCFATWARSIPTDGR